MPSQTESHFVAAVVKTPVIVLDKQMLEKVSGAGPHGGWSLHTEVTAASLAPSSGAATAFGPHGGW